MRFSAKSPCYPRDRRCSLDFARVLERVAPLFEERSLPFAVVGGIGLHAYGHDRATFDLDLITVSAAQAPLVARLEELGYETLHVSSGYSNHSHVSADWGGIDIVYVDEETAKQLFAAARRTLKVGSREVLVPAAEHLIAMKVQAIRNDPSRQLQDLADIQYLLGLPDTNRDQARAYFAKADMLEWYERIVARF